MSELAKKLVEVMAAVERIPKNGYNSFHNYAYATEADTAEAIRAELSKRGVLLLPAIKTVTREPVGEKGSVLTHLGMEFTFRDAETDEEITRPWLGAGTDKEDKGAYKAMTGGEKYFLLKTFLIPTGDDPEAEGQESARAGRKNTDRGAGNSSGARQAPTPQSPPDIRGEADGVRVVAVKEIKGQKNGKPWVMWAVKFSDGQEAATFSESERDYAEIAQRKKTLHNPVISVNNGKHKLEKLDREVYD